MNVSAWIRGGTLVLLCAASVDAAPGRANRPAALQSDLGKLELIDVARIPGAAELGWVEVERRRPGGWGWQCGSRRHLRSMSRLRREARDGPETESSPNWYAVLGAHLIGRLTLYSEEGIPGLGGRGRAFPWRAWLRDTLEKINRVADRSGMPQQKKEAALRNWVVCHVSEAEATLLLSLLNASTGEEE